MISKGQTLVNTITGERMTFLHTSSAETDGEYVLIELRAEPKAVVAAAHVHPAQVETFEIVSGTLGARSRKEVTAHAGDVLVVEPGKRTSGGTPARRSYVFRCEVRPALRFESLIETMFALAAAGKTSKKGMPNPLPACRHRAGALRHGALALPARAPTAHQPGSRRAARPAPRLPADLRAAAVSPDPAGAAA